jgi:hypothetical protein
MQNLRLFMRFTDRLRACRSIFQTSAAGAILAFGSGVSNASLTIDVRVTRIGSVNVTPSKTAFASPATTVTMQVWAQVTGSDPNKFKCVQDITGSFLSTGGALHGTLGATLVSHFAAPSASVGLITDLDGDGDLDVGSNNPSSAAGFYHARSDRMTGPHSNQIDGTPIPSLEVTTIPGGWEYRIATLRFVLGSAPVGAGTSINFRPSTAVDSTLWLEKANEFMQAVENTDTGEPGIFYTYGGGANSVVGLDLYQSGAPVLISVPEPAMLSLGIAGSALLLLRKGRKPRID